MMTILSIMRLCFVVAEMVMILLMMMKVILVAAVVLVVVVVVGCGNGDCVFAMGKVFIDVSCGCIRWLRRTPLRWSLC